MSARTLIAGLGWVVLLAVLHSVSTAQGQLQAGPTQLEVRPGSATTQLTLRNTGDAPVAAQIRAYAWLQTDGNDELVASDLVVASPPIMQIPPGGEQLVRIVRLGPPAVGHDQSYRIVVDELPRPDDHQRGSVSLRMRYVLPLFVRADDAMPPALSCAIDPIAAELACRNLGGQAVQLGASRLIDERGRSLSLSEGLLGYVLPGGRRQWPLPGSPDDWPRGPLHLDTQLNGQLTKLNVD